MASGLTINDDHVGMARGFRCSLDWNHLKRENSSGGLGGCGTVAIRVNNTRRHALLSPYTGHMNTGAGFRQTSLLLKNSQKQNSVKCAE